MGGIFGGGGGGTSVTQTAQQQQDINITNAIDFDALGAALDAFSVGYKELASQQIAVDTLQAQYQRAAVAIEAAKVQSTMDVTMKISAAITVAVLLFVLYQVYKGAAK